MGTTANGLPYPDPGTSVDVPRDIRTLAEAIPPLPASPLRAGSSVVTMGASGIATIVYPTPFTSWCTSVVASAGDPSGNLGQVQVRNFSSSRLVDFEFTPLTITGANITSGAIRVQFVAVGT